MQDIFVSTLTEHISSWAEAFPESKLVADVASVGTGPDFTDADYQEKPTYWLHMNEDRQQWMTNTIAAIGQHCANAKIVVLANVPNHAESLHALSLGAVGYAHAYVAPEVLKEIKTVISHGGLWLGQQLLQHLIETSTQLAGNKPERVDSLLARLTRREREVAIEAAKGLSNKEIARILNITERTVKAHLAATFERLGAKDRLQLALMLNKYQPGLF
ncbi:MAG: helix-turn-helix transcriptional regulator [Betaproteobacteria bacterium HGW-Betaproteobacteria-22]|nr:MAG: helix-turn-helix transcriptional regulator [Betaproteobacteria bacterium HGW-Betaproteobacteria-22]